VSEITYIYALSDPDTNNIRYIGKSDNPRKRYQNHLVPSREANYHKEVWVKSLRKKDRKPIMSIVCSVDRNEWEDAEKYFIWLFRELGFDLTNSSEGGQGTNNPSGNTRGRMSRSSKRRQLTPEQLESLRERARNLSKDPDVVARRSAKFVGQRRSKEFCRRISVRMMGWKPSEETREKNRQSHLGKKMSEANKEKLRRHTIFRNPEFIKKMKKRLKGRVFTPEWRKKISEGIRKHYQERVK
jgi:hypothetical protein